jgi:hypothetical protein
MLDSAAFVEHGMVLNDQGRGRLGPVDRWREAPNKFVAASTPLKGGAQRLTKRSA